MKHRKNFGLLVLFILSLNALASTPPKGIPNQAYPSNELFTVISEIPSDMHYQIPSLVEKAEKDISGTEPATTIMMDEYLFIYCGTTFELFDISDPYHPEFVHSRVFPWRPQTGQNPDAVAYGATTAYGGLHIIHTNGNDKLDFLDYSNVDLNDSLSPEIISTLTLLNPITKQECLDSGFQHPGKFPYPAAYAWQPPYLYIAHRTTGIQIAKVEDISNPQNVAWIEGYCDIGTPSVVYAVGNLLIFSLIEGKKIVTHDISDPENPVLLQKFTMTTDEKSAVGFVNGDVYYTSSDNAYSWDISDPSDITFIRKYSRPGGACHGHCGYGAVDIQDNYLHTGSSYAYVKFDIQTGQVVGKADSYKHPSRDLYTDWDYVAVFGNLTVAASEDNYQTTCLIPHQAEPDTKGPQVNMVNPKDGAVDQHVKSRVGMTFTDNIDLRSVNKSTFIVRPQGGEPLPGNYSTMRSIVNFCPHEPLQEGVTYEVVVPAGGITDYVGNPTEEEFISRFATGDAVAAIEKATEPFLHKRKSVLMTKMFDVHQPYKQNASNTIRTMYDIRGRQLTKVNPETQTMSHGIYFVEY